MSEKTLTQAQMIRTWTAIIIRVIFFIIGLAIIAWLIYQLGTMILLLIVSIFFCYLIAPLVRVFEQPLYIAGREIRIPRGLAIFLVYVLIGVILYAGVRLITPLLSQQVAELRQNLPQYSEYVKAWVTNADSSLRHTLPPQIYETLSEKTTELTPLAFHAVETLINTIVSLLPYLIWLILVPILSFFLLKDAAKIEHGLVNLMPTERLQKRIRWLLLDVSRTLAAYIRAQITACVEVGSLVTIGLMIIGTPYALVLGLISAVLEFFPMIGPLIGGATAFALTLITVSFNKAIVVMLFLIVLRIVQDYIIYPRIVGQGIEMHPLVVILAILGGAEVYGLIGVFLSIPFVAMMMVTYSHYVAYRGLQTAGPASAAPVGGASDEAALKPQLPVATGALPALEK